MIFGSTYLVLYLYAVLTIRKSDPELKPLLGVIPPKKED
jgi:hypothetical protein